MKNLAIYIHIPFCQSKCKYCDFVSAPSGNQTKAEYIQALINEINQFDTADYIVDTIFIGGGTPSSLDDGVLYHIIEVIKNNFNCNIMEFTVECNPNSLTELKLKEYISCGVTRISLGIQSFDDKVLHSIGRSHNRVQALAALKLLKASKLDFSVDLMIGLPNQNIQNLENDIDTIMEYGVGHISCYSLILEESTPIYEMVRLNKIVLPSEDETVDMYNAVYNKLQNYGLCRYEISNFGKPCIHNIGYWNLHSYAGFGASAHSLIDRIRYYNVKDIKEYINLYSNNNVINTNRTISSETCALNANNINNDVIINSNYIIEEVLTDKDCVTELIMLGLRMDKGVCLDDIAKYGQNYLDATFKIAEKLKKYLLISTTYMSIKPQYAYISNSIIEEFLTI